MSSIARLIDLTILNPDADEARVLETARMAAAHGFASVCVHPVWVRAAVWATGGAVPVCTVSGFPLGTNKPTLKAIEAASAVKDGASEVDVVALLPNLIAGDVDAARAELMEIVRGARAARRDVVIKVIVESARLLQCDEPEQKIMLACQAVRESGADFIKTSTGFHPSGGADAQAVRWMKKYADGLLVKAAGGIRDLKTARAMIEAGADRLGCSDGMGIIAEERQ